MQPADRMPPTTSRSRRGARGAVLVASGATLGATLCAAGCAKSLFPSDLPRNQFETHDRMRQAYTPLEEPDVFGTPQPALRARLTQQQ